MIDLRSEILDIVEFNGKAAPRCYYTGCPFCGDPVKNKKGSVVDLMSAKICERCIKKQKVLND